jgi:hypothetical protein
MTLTDIGRARIADVAGNGRARRDLAKGGRALT